MKQITEDYCSFETAKLLKEKGFDEFTFSNYNENGIIQFNEVETRVAKGYQRPTHQMALKWLREVHNICITIDGYPTIDGSFEFKPRIFNSTGKYWEDWHLSYKAWFVSYEEAVEAALNYVLKNLI